MGTSSLQMIQAYARLYGLYKQGEFFVPHLVRHGPSVSVVLSNRPSHLAAMERAQIQKIFKGFGLRRQKYVDTRHQRAHVSKNKNKMQLFIYFLLFWFFSLLLCFMVLFHFGN